MPKLNKKQRRAEKNRRRVLRNKNKRERLLIAREKHQPWVPVKMNYFQAPDVSVPGMSREERLNALREFGKKAEGDLREKYPRIDRYFEEYDALYLLSYASFYWMTHPEGIDLEAIGKQDIYHHYLEILQALSLTRHRTLSAKPLLSDATTLKEAIIEVGELLPIRLFSLLPETEDTEEVYAYSIRMEIMQSTAAVRNWAYPEQIKKILLDLSSLISNDFEAAFGINPTTFIRVLFLLSEGRDSLVDSHMQKLRAFGRKNNYKEMIAEYNKAFPENKRLEESDAEELWERSGRNLDALTVMLLSHADLKLPNLFSFTLAQAKALANPKEDIQRLGALLDKLSYSFGDLKDFDRYHVFYENPIHLRPLIKTADDKYFSIMWGVMPHVILDVFENLLRENEDLKKKYEKVKAKYLEDEVERMFREGFPNASIYRGSKWVDELTGKEFQNDLAVVVDNFAIIVEAKSATVTNSARRGAPARLKKTLEELVGDPSEQANRFIDLLKSKKQVHHLANGAGGENAIDSSEILYYIPVGVTLSNLGMITGNLHKIVRAKLLPKTLTQLALSISITDLEIIFDLLPLEAQKIHYLARRKELEANFKYEGDEMDLLGFYLENNFNIGAIEFSGDVFLNLALKSKELDPYYTGRSSGCPVRKPEARLTQWWKDMLVTLAYRKKPGWITRSCVLLNSAKADQEVFEHKLRKMKSRVKSGRVIHKHNWLIFMSGPENRRFGIVGYPYTITDREEMRNCIADILSDPQMEKSRGAVVIGLDLNHNDYPYSIMASTRCLNLFDCGVVNSMSPN